VVNELNRLACEGEGRMAMTEGRRAVLSVHKPYHTVQLFIYLLPCMPHT